MTVTSSFSREEIDFSSAKLLRDGKLFNARVWLIKHGNTEWTYKDFSTRPWYVRVLARFLLWREEKALRRLKGLDGFAPDVVRVDGDSLAIVFMPGQALVNLTSKEVTVEFLEKLEALTRAMHQRGIVHLDIGSLGNVLIRPDGTPAIIDPQASLCTDHMPRWLKSVLEDVDMRGSYKKWLKFQPEQMGEKRRMELARINRLRSFWPFRGYSLPRFKIHR